MFIAASCWLQTGYLRKKVAFLPAFCCDPGMMFNDLLVNAASPSAEAGPDARTRRNFFPPGLPLFAKRITPWIAAWLFAAAGVGQAQLAVYQQPPTTNGYNSEGSTNTPAANISVTYDNFTLASGADIVIVNWQGLYVDLDNLGNNPESLDTSSFIISFYSDNDNQPGTLLTSQTVSVGACNALELTTVNFNNGTGGSATVPIYSYSVQLPTAFAASAKVQYWISIVSNCSADDPRWQWTSGTGGDGVSFQLLSSGFYQVSGDRAFTLALSHPPFFAGEADLGGGVYYLAFPAGNYFGYYSYLTDPDYLYHFDLGYEYVFDAQDGHGGVYLYDFASGDFFYTGPNFPFPYLYDFGLNTVLYYYPDTASAGHYTSNPRYFFDYATGAIITK